MRPKPAKTLKQKAGKNRIRLAMPVDRRGILASKINLLGGKLKLRLKLIRPKIAKNQVRDFDLILEISAVMTKKIGRVPMKRAYS